MTRTTKFWTATVVPLIAALLVLTTRIYDLRRWDVFKGVWLDTVPISFYGKVVDAQGRALTGVDVKLRVTTVNWPFILGGESPRRQDDYVVQTDKAGLFQLEGISGANVILCGLSKAGYEFKPRLTGGGNWENSYIDFTLTGNPTYKPDRTKPETYELVPVTR